MYTSSSHWTILSQFRSKVPLKKPRNMRLSLRKAPLGFRTWLSGLDTLYLATGCLRKLLHTSSKQQWLCKKLRGNLLAVSVFLKSRRCLYIITLQRLISSHRQTSRTLQTLLLDIGDDRLTDRTYIASSVNYNFLSVFISFLIFLL